MRNKDAHNLLFIYLTIEVFSRPQNLSMWGYQRIPSFLLHIFSMLERKYQK